MNLPEGRYITTANGRRMHLHAIGEGEPLLFLHGSGPGASGGSNFRHNAEVIGAAGYECLLLDALGYGRSDKPTDVGYGLDVMAGEALGVLPLNGSLLHASGAFGGILPSVVETKTGNALNSEMKILQAAESSWVPPF